MPIREREFQITGAICIIHQISKYPFPIEIHRSVTRILPPKVLKYRSVHSIQCLPLLVCVRACVHARVCVCMCVRACVRACVCVVSVIVKRPVLPPSVVDGRSRNPLYYYY